MRCCPPEITRRYSSFVYANVCVWWQIQFFFICILICPTLTFAKLAICGEDLNGQAVQQFFFHLPLLAYMRWVKRWQVSVAVLPIVLQYYCFYEPAESASCRLTAVRNLNLVFVLLCRQRPHNKTREAEKGIKKVENATSVNLNIPIYYSTAFMHINL